MSERRRAVLRFSLQAAACTVVLLLAEYTASLIRSGSPARFVETLAEHGFEVVPVFVALGALWALGMRAISQWEKRRAARRGGGGQKGKAA